MNKMKQTTAAVVQETEDNRAEQQARCQLDSIVEMVAALEKAEREDDEGAKDEARETLQEDALSVQVRGGWHSPGDEEGAKAEEFEILLCTGGPACRIVGDLTEHGQPERPRLQYQDWGTPWTEYFTMNRDEREALESYCAQFYFGE